MQRLIVKNTDTPLQIGELESNWFKSKRGKTTEIINGKKKELILHYAVVFVHRHPVMALLEFTLLHLNNCNQRICICQRRNVLFKFFALSFLIKDVQHKIILTLIDNYIISWMQQIWLSNYPNGFGISQFIYNTFQSHIH